MAAIGGSILEISIHGRPFSVAADNDVTRRLSGTTNEVVANGDGTVRTITTRGPWSLSGLVVSCDPDREDHEFLDDIIRRRAYGDITISFADNSVYGGTGTVTGELSYSSNAATCTFDLMGPNRLTLQ